MIDIKRADALRAALSAAKPGQTLQLAPGTYRGSFVVNSKGTGKPPITLRGPATAVLQNDGSGKKVRA